MVGRFSDASGTALGDWDLLLGLEAHGLVYGAGMTSSADRPILNIGSTAFVVPETTVALMRASAGQAQNGLTKILAGFGLRPQLWVRGARIVGHETLGGVAVDHLTFAADPTRVLRDAARFTQLLTALGVTRLGDLPQAIGPAAQAALARSVTSAQGNAYIGTSDHVTRRARITLTLAVPAADRAALAGISSASVEVNLDVSEVGAPQQIRVQADQQSWAQAVTLLDAAAFSNREPGQRGN